MGKDPLLTNEYSMESIGPAGFLSSRRQVCWSLSRLQLYLPRLLEQLTSCKELRAQDVFFSWRGGGDSQKDFGVFLVEDLHDVCSPFTCHVQLTFPVCNVSFWILSDFTCLAQVLRTKVCSLALHLEHSRVEILFESAEGPNNWWTASAVVF